MTPDQRDAVFLYVRVIAYAFLSVAAMAATFAGRTLIAFALWVALVAALMFYPRRKPMNDGPSFKDHLSAFVVAGTNLAQRCSPMEKK